MSLADDEFNELFLDIVAASAVAVDAADNLRHKFPVAAAAAVDAAAAATAAA